MTRIVAQLVSLFAFNAEMIVDVGANPSVACKKLLQEDPT